MKINTLKSNSALDWRTHDVRLHVRHHLFDLFLEHFKF